MVWFENSISGFEGVRAGHSPIREGRSGHPHILQISTRKIRKELATPLDARPKGQAIFDGQAMSWRL